MKYIAKPGTWFKAGTECKFLGEIVPGSSGLFEGIRVVENSAAEAGYPVGMERLDEEVCGFDEFEVIDE